MADQKKHNAESIKLFTFNQIGAALNAGTVSEQDASKVLIERARRKATAKGTEAPAVA